MNFRIEIREYNEYKYIAMFNSVAAGSSGILVQLFVRIDDNMVFHGA